MKRVATTFGGRRPSPSAVPPPAYLHTYDEAGRLLGGLSRRQIGRLIETDELHGVTLGPRNHRVTDESVRAYIARHRKPPTSANDEVGPADD